MSRYSNRIMKNNVFATLSTAVSSIATTIQLTSGQGARFGNDFPQIATIESFDGDGKVVKREIVEITGRTDDALTVVRAYAPCPSNDDANTQSQSSFSFSSDDKISLYIPKEIFDRIADSIKDLYDNGNDRVYITGTGGLNISVTGGNVRVGSQEFEYNGGTATLIDNSTNYVMIDGNGTIEISTSGRDQQKSKIATIITSGGEIISIKRWKMDIIGGVLGGSSGFKNISSCVYKDGLLISFVADGEAFTLTYEKGRLKTIVSGEKTYTMTYKNGKLISSVEN